MFVRCEVALLHAAKCAVILCCMLTAALSFATDLKISQRTTSPEVLAASTTYMQGPRTRYEARSVNGYQAWRGGPWVSLHGHRFATILQVAPGVPISPFQTEPSGA